MLAEMGAAAFVAAGAVQSLAFGQQSQSPPSDSRSQHTGGKPTDPGPENKPLIQENPDSWSPVHTDAGDVNAFKYSFALGHNRVSDGGWARQVTVRDLPIAKDIAGVNMRLEKGAIRELHWHVPAEWAYMLYGTARITGVDSAGRAFVDDVGPGDLWYFPQGVPHSIQGIGDDGCEFLLAFDDGRFSEFDTFLITDWADHTPKDVLGKNFDTSPSTFDPIPPKELYIFKAPMPASLEQDRRKAYGPEGPVPNPFSHGMLAQKPDVSRKGGEVRITDSSRFKASITVAAAHVKLKPGGLRELHWHPNADEWQYWITGKGRMTVFTGGSKARTMDFQAGDVGYIQQSLPHYIENTGDSDLEFLELFKSSFYQDISFGQWISHLPPELVQAHLRLNPEFLASVPKEKMVVLPA
ncbi:MAG TPA: cupin domain-containing protein [Tepidisphaeraceae bacterium]|nr:cupin domain-containing protein [Tepidisphaeraceae bacterium]